MNTFSLLSLTAALMLSATPLALAQTSAAGTVDAGTTVESTTGGSVTGSGSVNAGATVDANGVDLSLDTNADGTVDADETAAGANAQTEVEVETDLSLDTDGDGVVSAEEARAGQAAMGDMDCSSIDLGATVSAEGLATIQSATTAQIQSVSDCNEDGAGIGGDVATAVFGNAAIAAMLTADGIAEGDVIGVNVSDAAVILYVDNGDDMSGSDDSSDADTTTEGTTAQ
ncbi:EF-hand domain-containing protein [Devosia beringensis]|uniref:hypothetical protein n=1 Tax=Devosia beringensis TaxID=2657486 RepID=UPI00186BB05C|nr:hypothetical protein [Devosia beringensis]